jgi:hypothetical protein
VAFSLPFFSYEAKVLFAELESQNPSPPCSAPRCLGPILAVLPVPSVEVA